MVERSVRSACDRGMASLRMGDQNLLFRAPPCFGRHVKPAPVAFAKIIAESLSQHDEKHFVPHLVG
jgi:hypothetical protein